LPLSIDLARENCRLFGVWIDCQIREQFVQEGFPAETLGRGLRTIDAVDNFGQANG